MNRIFAFLFMMLSLSACSQNQATNKYENVSNEVFAEKMTHNNTVILDVRTPEEFKAGHIPGAQLINFHDPDFAGKIKALDKEKTYVVYCQGGTRSSKASALMEKEGFSKVYNLEKGFSQWNGATEK